MSRPPSYGIIYNWDGAPHGYSEVPQSVGAFLEKTYAPLEDTQVGALFWCIGERAKCWPTKDLETVDAVHGRRYERAGSYVATENVRQMLERGKDPQKALIQRGRELGVHVYASVRMNDNHFRGAQVEDLPTMHHTELTRLRIEHPEWVLGDKTLEWFALSWNMSVPEVREHRFAFIKELCTRYDWDGVELDWQRHAFHLPAADAVNAGRKVRRGSAQKCSTYAMYTPSLDGCQFSPMIASVEPPGCGGLCDVWTPAGDSSRRWLPGRGCGA